MTSAVIIFLMSEEDAMTRTKPVGPITTYCAGGAMSVARRRDIDAVGSSSLQPA